MECIKHHPSFCDTDFLQLLVQGTSHKEHQCRHVCSNVCAAAIASSAGKSFIVVSCHSFTKLPSKMWEVRDCSQVLEAGDGQ